MAKPAVIILAIISAAFAAPPSPTSHRIVGGAPTSIEVYPYLASLQLWQSAFSSHACGGSLITRQAILSASHCFYYHKSALLWSARVGSSHRSSGGEMLEGKEIILHENYDHETLVNDIAILKLASSAILSHVVKPATIAPQLYNIPENTVVTAIGWGVLNQGSTVLPEQLQHVDVNVINQKVCVERYDFLRILFVSWPYRVNDGMICSGILNVGGKDACQGDSGGPLSHKTSEGDVLIGVTSFGYGCGQAYFPGVYARVSHYSNWIAKHGSM